MQIAYTKHAEKKFTDLKELGVVITKILIKTTLSKPLNIDATSDYPNKIAVGLLNKSHILRVVYREEHDTIVVITFYPARKERYL